MSVLGENIVDAYESIDNGKDMWDALEAKFGVSDAGTELYIMEQFYDYRMTEERSVVEQAHEIQSFARELEHFSCMLPDNVRSKKEQKEYKEFEQLFSVSVHCNQTHMPGNS